MYRLISIKGARFGRRRCQISKGNTLADTAIARSNTFAGKWFVFNKKVLLDAIKNADSDLKNEILGVLIPNGSSVQTIVGELHVKPTTIEIVGEEADFEDLSIEELFSYCKKLEIPTRKDNKKETLIKKIQEKLGE